MTTTHPTHPPADMWAATGRSEIANKTFDDLPRWMGRTTEVWENVKAWEAKGDGVTDDSVAIRNCIDFVTAAGGGTVYFPKGRYKVTVAGVTHTDVTADIGNWFSTIGYIANVTSNTRLTGPGTIYQTGVPAIGDVAPWTNQYTVFAIGGGVTNVVIDGLTFEGENNPFVAYENNQAACVMAYTSGVTTDVTVKHCTFKNLYGFSFHSVGSSTARINATDNTFIDCANGLNVNASYAQIRGNIFSNSEGIECSAAFTTIADNVLNGCTNPLSLGGDTSGAEMRGIVVSGNRINTSPDCGIVIADGVRGASIIGNTITRCDVGAIAFTRSTGYNPSHCVFTGNNIYGNNAYPSANVTAVNLAGGGHHVFVGNRVWDDDNTVTTYYQQIGILVGAASCYIAGNHIYTSDRLGTSKAISVNSSLAALIGENYFTGVGRVEWGSASAAAVARSFYDGSEVAFEHRFSNVTATALFALYGSGKMEWGTGVAGRDISASRVAANVLGFASGDSIQLVGIAHASLPSPASYPAGSQLYCSTDKKPVWSDGSAHWVDAAGANHT